MTLPLEDVLRLIISNHKRTGNPVGIDMRRCVEWAENISMPRSGEKILYTSCMYQMAPYIKRLVEQLAKTERHGLSGVALKLGGVLSRVIDVTSIMGVSENERKRSSEILMNIVKILLRYDVNIAYLYEEEPYSGALLYELGLEEYFIDHAKKVVEIFRKHGVKKIITIDPHTHHVLKDVYPKYVDNFDFEVTHYIEILSERTDLLTEIRVSDEYVIHDPCLLARYLNIIDQPRKVLEKIGIKIREPSRSRERTRCCGGPIESISPSLSGSMAKIRLEELSRYSRKILVMCPICFISLSRYADEYNVEIKDLAELLR